jgi:hypothetical protein
MKYKLAAVVLALLIISGALLKFLVFTEARKVHHTLLALEQKISAPADGGGLDLALYLAALKPFFTPAVSITISGGALEKQWQFERADLLRAITSAKQQNPALTVTLDFTRQDVTVSGVTARVDAWVTAQNLNELIEPQRLSVILEKGGDKKWRVATVETPRENQPQKDADDETEH